MGKAVKDTAELTKDRDGFGCAKLVVFANAVEDNPFMAGAFYGPGEGDCSVSVGVSGPGAVKRALETAKGEPFEGLAEGYYTVRALNTLAKETHVDLPISRTIEEVLYEERPIKEALFSLFERSLKDEF